MYYLYGDESESKGLAVYSIVICPQETLSIFTERICDIKARYQVAHSAKFHCRELFNGSLRRKSAWRHLTERQAYQVALDLTVALGGMGLETTLGIVDTSILGASILPVGNSKTHKMNLKEHIIPFAFQAAIAPLLSDQRYKGRMKLWVDPNSSKIDWFGKSPQAHSLLTAGELDTKELKRKDVLVPENLINKERPLGLEIADLLAYSGARALAKQHRATDYVFDEIIRLISPAKYPFKWVTSSLVNQVP